MTDAEDVIAINRGDCLALTDADVVLHFETMLDFEGEETDDPAEAMVAVAQHPNTGEWWSIDLRGFEASEAH